MHGFVGKGVLAGWKTRGPLLFTASSTPAQPRRLVFSLRKGSTTHGSGKTGASSGNTSGQSSSQGNKYLLSGATIATLFMLGVLHARRLYDDQKSEQARQQGIEPEFQPDFKAAFLQILPLRLISRTFGMLTSVELPVWTRPYIFRGYCRAFHANVDEASEKLEDYESIQKFFVRTLKDGCRPLDSSSSCLISPVDGVMLRCGQIKGPGLAVEQVKGHSYSLRALLGGEPRILLTSTCSDIGAVDGGAKAPPPKLRDTSLFYCVLYLGPGDYHRVHSPVDWHVLYRRHLSGRLFPVNERATRTIGNLYVGNERVVLEGLWEKGFMALVAVGATNVGSIELKIEPDLKTNCQMLFSPNLSLTSFRKYGDNGMGHFIQKGDEVATFNLGSTVVLVFQAPRAEEEEHGGGRGFKFCVKQGQRVQMGQAIGKW
ncbi:hypothetical protein GOP47_0011173 [Adiantum capillus-veneris]|uniref:Phosphatidylserine decarboxylase proenzyme 1, mitochondrial n=1 Tax=Adiantum capillus-veneris TaxID=13818 RepID=A0A9D4USN9_ADICA|nr:hypothetical protein GOP47_0011173 [Adiantum capillus-veneris]